MLFCIAYKRNIKFHSTNTLPLLSGITQWAKWTLQTTYTKKDVCTLSCVLMLGLSRNHFYTSKYNFIESSPFSFILLASQARPCKSFKNISNIQSTTKGTREDGEKEFNSFFLSKVRKCGGLFMKFVTWPNHHIIFSKRETTHSLQNFYPMAPLMHISYDFIMILMENENFTVLHCCVQKHKSTEISIIFIYRQTFSWIIKHKHSPGFCTRLSSYYFTWNFTLENMSIFSVIHWEVFHSVATAVADAFDINKLFCLHRRAHKWIPTMRIWINQGFLISFQIKTPAK